MRRERRELRWLWAVWVAAAFGLWAMGCGDDQVGGATCYYDSDCPGNAYCVQEVCADGCAQDEECGGGLTCEVYQRTGEADPIQVCLADENSPDGVECTTDQECREALGDENARCGLHDLCVRPGENGANGLNQNGSQNQNQNQNGVNHEPEPEGGVYLLVEQLDRDGEPVGQEEPDTGEGEDDGEESGEEEEIDEEEEPAVRPVRISAVLVRNSAGEAVGYGEVESLEGPGEVYGELVEAPISLDDDRSCLAEPREATYVSLGGPGGEALIRLRTGPGLMTSIEEGWRVQVVADGEACLLGEAMSSLDPDRPFGEYRAFLCVSEGEEFSREEDCQRVYEGPLRGFSDLEVTTEE